jgi:hypothetical protein
VSAEDLAEVAGEVGRIIADAEHRDVALLTAGFALAVQCLDGPDTYLLWARGNPGHPFQNRSDRAALRQFLTEQGPALIAQLADGLIAVATAPKPRPAPPLVPGHVEGTRIGGR